MSAASVIKFLLTLCSSPCVSPESAAGCFWHWWRKCGHWCCTPPQSHLPSPLALQVYTWPPNPAKKSMCFYVGIIQFVPNQRANWVAFPMEQEKKSWSLYPLHRVTFYGWYYNNIAGYHYYFYRCVPMLKTPCICIFISLFWAKLSCFYTFLTNAHWHYCLPIDYTDLILLLFLLIKHLTVSFHTCNIETLSFYGSIAYWFTNLLSKQRVAGSVPSRDTNPFWKVSENASGVKPCQRKLTELLWQPSVTSEQLKVTNTRKHFKVVP